MKTHLISATMIMAGALLAAPAFGACDYCGTVTNVKTVVKEGEASGGGAVVGGIVGGVLGHQVGSGRGNTAATVVGAAGGAYAGNQIGRIRTESRSTWSRCSWRAATRAPFYATHGP
jgi:uncharacterized protein YcfJ